MGDRRCSFCGTVNDAHHSAECIDTGGKGYAPAEPPASLGPVLSDLLSALKPFAEAAKGMAWESTPDHITFYPVNSLGSKSKPISAGAMRRAMEIYAKYGK